jgi:hypothetical protein
MRMMLGHLSLPRHQQIGMQDLPFLPRIADIHLRIAFIADDRQQRGILQFQGVTLFLQKPCAVSAGRQQRRNESYEDKSAHES